MAVVTVMTMAMWMAVGNVADDGSDSAAGCMMVGWRWC